MRLASAGSGSGLTRTAARGPARPLRLASGPAGREGKTRGGASSRRGAEPGAGAGPEGGPRPGGGGCSRRRRRCRGRRGRRRAERGRRPPPAAAPGRGRRRRRPGRASSRFALWRGAVGTPRRQGSALAAGALAQLVAVLLEALRLPDLKGAAEADKGGILGDAGMVAQRLWQDDAALAVEGELLRIGEDRGQRVTVLGELVERIDAGAHLFHAVDAAAFERRQLERAEGDDPGKALSRQRGAEGRGDGHAALLVDLVDECGQEQRHTPAPTALASTCPLTTPSSPH